jgi:hypothetical protein
MKTPAKEPGPSVALAVFRDPKAVERAVRRLHKEGFNMCNLSVVGRDFEVSDDPAGFVTTGDCTAVGAEIGAFVGGIFGLCVGMGFLVLPVLGPVIVAGPISAALLGGIEGTAGGAALGALAGGLVGWGVPSVHVRKYEQHVKGGKFLVLARGDARAIEHAKSVLWPESPEHLEIFDAQLEPSSHK